MVLLRILKDLADEYCAECDAGQRDEEEDDGDGGANWTLLKRCEKA